MWEPDGRLNMNVLFSSFTFGDSTIEISDTKLEFLYNIIKNSFSDEIQRSASYSNSL